jgi:hypothetical protein
LRGEGGQGGLWELRSLTTQRKQSQQSSLSFTSASNNPDPPPCHVDDNNDSVLTSTTAVQQQQQPPAFPPVHVNSSWIANQWIPATPSQYRIYSAFEILEYFRHQRILFVGDSTGRRTYMTLLDLFHTVSSSTHPNDIRSTDIDNPLRLGLNKIEVTQPCQTYPNHTICEDIPSPYNITTSFVRFNCLFELVSYVQQQREEDTDSDFFQFDIIVFIVGPWEVMEKDCQSYRYGRRNATQDLFQSLFEWEEQIRNPEKEQKDKLPTIIWRTWGSPGATRHTPQQVQQYWEFANIHNTYVKHILDVHEQQYWNNNHNTIRRVSAISYIDWGTAMYPRLLPESQRIQGDMDPHYGLEARLCFVQMFINHLKERDRLQRYHIAPYAVFTSSASSNILVNNNIPTTATLPPELLNNAQAETFLSLTPISSTATLSNEDTIQLQELEKIFCVECIWRGQIPCMARRNYMETHHKLDALEALQALLDTECFPSQSSPPQ